ncbi:MAG TPA: septal ring lytic transglycosylase RlpA family protein [Solirubrobacteraceae bacterium]|jgi:hypothetical protein|nr:septal ring lytic transglycosylase RlpA family protein [Solirubrobacteraceae bacterium]
MWALTTLRSPRVCAAAGVLCAAYALTAGSPLAAGADAGPSASTGHLTLTVPSGPLRFHQRVSAAGRIASGQSGVAVSLQFRAPGRPWRTVASTRTARGGTYRLTASLDRSGRLRTVLAGPSEPAQARTAGVGAGAVAPVATSTEQPVAVGAAMVAVHGHLDVLAGRPVTVAGVILPGQPGRFVSLEVLRGHIWRPVAQARTRLGGAYRVRYSPSQIGSQPVRVRFKGDRLNAPSRRNLGALNVYHVVGASWYDASGSVACSGRHGPGTLGVAHRTLPCGTRVRLSYRGRTVVARVIDRGPYVGGRDYDLTAATKQALGFGDTGAIWATR